MWRLTRIVFSLPHNGGAHSAPASRGPHRAEVCAVGWRRSGAGHGAPASDRARVRGGAPVWLGDAYQGGELQILMGEFSDFDAASSALHLVAETRGLG